MTKPAVTFVIMAGGRGERLWPLVRTASPKVCLSPDGTRSLLRATIDRLGASWPGAAWLIVTTHEQASAVRAALPARLRRSLMVEPEARNTAACITLAALTVAAREPQRILVIAPADHWVGDVPTFRRAIRAGIVAAAREDAIATVGIRPTHPHPGLGYLCAGHPLPGPRRPRVFRLDRFVEKPAVAAAARLVARPCTFWNSGIFIGAAEQFLLRVTEWLPEHARRLAKVASAAGRNSHRPTPDAVQAYRALPAVSFDHGVMDHLRAGGLVVEGAFPWADLGSWDTWARLGAGGARTVSVDSRGITVVSQGDHLVATVGVRDLVVVHTPSATLVCRADQAQAVRDVVRRLGADARLARYR